MDFDWITQLPFAAQIAIVFLVGFIFPCFARDIIRYVHRKRKRLRDLKECIKWLQPDLEATKELNNTDFAIMCNRLFSGCDLGTGKYHAESVNRLLLLRFLTKSAAKNPKAFLKLYGRH